MLVDYRRLIRKLRQESEQAMALTLPRPMSIDAYAFGICVELDNAFNGIGISVKKVIRRLRVPGWEICFVFDVPTLFRPRDQKGDYCITSFVTSPIYYHRGLMQLEASAIIGYVFKGLSNDHIAVPWFKPFGTDISRWQPSYPRSHHVKHNEA
jgi:hypothetical protein